MSRSHTQGRDSGHHSEELSSRGQCRAALGLRPGGPVTETKPLFSEQERGPRGLEGPTPLQAESRTDPDRHSADTE